MAKTLFQKVVKSFAYASAGGAIAVGAGSMNLVDADFATILYMVVAAVFFNFLKELAKQYIG